MTNEQIAEWVILTFEGVFYTDDPVDRGGATKYGITLRTYAYWRQRYAGLHTTTKGDVASMTLAQAVRVAVDVFMIESRIAELTNYRTKLAVYDYAFHSGSERAVQALQRELGLNADGVIGPITLAREAQNIRILSLPLLVLTRREEFMQEIMTKNQTQRKYLLGWWNRTTKLQRKLLEGAL